MSAVLIIETSTESASIALAMAGEVVMEKSFVSNRRHNSLLFEPLSEILKTFDYPALKAVLVGSGPGSYSGTRVGIATAQGAALVASCQAIALPSLLATPPALSGKACLAVGDARRGSYWLAEIKNSQLLHGPALTDAAGLHAALEHARENNVTYFSMETLRDREIPQFFPTASGLWQIWQNAPETTRLLWTEKIPQPIYISPPHITASKKISYGQA